MATPSWIIPAPKASTPAYTPKVDPNSGTYRDIFNYMDGGFYSPQSLIDPGLSQMGDNAQHNFVDPNAYNTWKAKGPYENVIGIEDYSGMGDDSKGAGKRFKVDYSKLPNGGMTKFGSVQDVIPIRSQKELNNLRNKGMVYYDPNYGLITHRNNKKDSLWDTIPGMAVQLGAGAMLGGAAGAVAGGAFAGAGLSSSVGTALGRFGAAVGQSNGKINAGQIGSLAGGMLGAPSWATGLARTGYDMAQNRGRGG